MAITRLTTLLRMALLYAGEKRVYNITDYVDEHPGGDSILNNVGKDSSEGFHGPQHPATVFVLLEDYCIGGLVD